MHSPLLEKLILEGQTPAEQLYIAIRRDAVEENYRFIKKWGQPRRHGMRQYILTR